MQMTPTLATSSNMFDYLMRSEETRIGHGFRPSVGSQSTGRQCHHCLSLVVNVAFEHSISSLQRVIIKPSGGTLSFHFEEGSMCEGLDSIHLSQTERRPVPQARCSILQARDSLCVLSAEYKMAPRKCRLREEDEQKLWPDKIVVPCTQG